MTKSLQTKQRRSRDEPLLATGPSKVRRLLHPSVNITPPERASRIALGLLGVVAGVVLLASAGSAHVGIFLEILLVLAGLDLVVTGAIGHCPLYQKLGYSPASLRRPT